MKKLLLIMMILISCESTEVPKIINDYEIITTVKLILKIPNTIDSVEFIFEDIDGNGGNEPIINTSKLKSNTNYDGRIEFLNKSVIPTHMVNNDIITESEDHQVFYEFLDPSKFTFSYKDQDNNGYPLGLKFNLITKEISKNKLTITLRHKPNKTAQFVKEGNILNAEGETDINVDFEFNVE